MDKTFTTPAGTTVHARPFKHKRGTLVGYSLEPGAYPLVVTGTNNRVYREHYGFSHMTTAWAGRDMADRPSGEDHHGLASARRSALAFIDRLECPADHCRVHNDQPATTPGRCASCTAHAEAVRDRLAAELAG